VICFHNTLIREGNKEISSTSVIKARREIGHKDGEDSNLPFLRQQKQKAKKGVSRSPGFSKKLPSNYMHSKEEKVCWINRVSKERERDGEREDGKTCLG